MIAVMKRKINLILHQRRQNNKFIAINIKRKIIGKKSEKDLVNFSSKKYDITEIDIGWVLTLIYNLNRWKMTKINGYNDNNWSLEVYGADLVKPNFNFKFKGIINISKPLYVHLLTVLIFLMLIRRSSMFFNNFCFISFFLFKRISLFATALLYINSRFEMLISKSTIIFSNVFFNWLSFD